MLPTPVRRNIGRACDLCRRRKAKCDGALPQCSRCQALKVSCEYFLPRTKRGPKPQSRTPDSGDVDRHSQGRTLATTPEAERVDVERSKTPSLAQNVSHTDHLLSDFTTPLTDAFSEDSVVRPRTFPANSPREIHSYLTSTLADLDVETDVFVQNCVEYWVGTSFSVLPFLRPATILENIPLLLPSAESRFPAKSYRGSLHDEFSTEVLEDMRAFALLCGICSMRAQSVLQHSSLVRHQALADALLSSSRAMLACCEDADVAQPSISSVVIRIFQSSALHFQGKNRMSRYMVGQALRLTIDMRLFDEKSYDGLGAEERQLRRNLFWLMHTMDKSMSLLNNLPPTLHVCLKDPAQVETNLDGTPVRLLDGIPWGQFNPTFERQLRVGFDLIMKQWLIAGNIHRDLDLLDSYASTPSAQSDGLLLLKSHVTQDWLAFCSLLDVLPHWIRDPSLNIADGQGEEAADAHREAHWIQHANLVVNYHSLKIILMAKAFKLRLVNLMGLTEDEGLFILRNTEIASELMHALEKMPLAALQGNGESLVEKLRQVGIVLIEIAHRVANDALALRAKSILDALLVLIANLNSRYSDKLGEEAL
ncbi:hypothetical protein BU24DRAFT_491055 [Aaosphaeria arxii CBS 175.79]|uniref:Zn(2)-C6 fungal-type domain-containing protein n=1 Tax=Aaosphaeria arxii CBS 175.79 TaxID=1450172 RepID=A0A6A5XYV1_9PLEO|nr:uncharacterized protein BU24DRAFT_491055 [Aaosphaeria arxii CBS 175.79]KAF2017997.1 hypothetical protein BU24DRAFT_491055 [Aaosphaeria arxii CBS 175.79]